MPGSKPVNRTTHNRALRRLRCVVSNTDQQIELHHCHGGSMLYAWPTGMSQKSNDFLQIPLTFKYHRGQFDPEHIGMARWEELFGAQLDHLHTVSELLGYDVLHLAAEWNAAHRQTTGENYGPGADT